MGQTAEIDVVNLVIASIGAITGILGAFAGVIALRHQLDQSRVKLRVTPKSAAPVGSVHIATSKADHIGDMLCIEVINLSSFAVTVCEVGLHLRGMDANSVKILSPTIIRGGSLPYRLEPHQAIDCVCGDVNPLAIEHSYEAYAKTDCDHVATGTSPAMAAMRKRAAALPAAP